MKLDSLVLGLFLALGAQAEAGTSNGGGGVAMVCRVSGGIQAAYLLDLVEGSANGISLRHSTNDIRQEYAVFLSELRRVAGDPRPVEQSELDQFEADIKSFKYTAPGEHLEFLGDTGELIAPPKNCAYEQLAIWDDKTNKVTVDSEIWNALNPMNKVALFAHEVLYKEHRLRFEDWTSAATRKLVPLFFSPKPAPMPMDGVPTQPKSTVVCAAGIGAHWTRAHIYASPSNPNHTTIQFDQFFGLNVLTPTRIQLPVKIQHENLVQKIVGPELVIKVDDQSANYFNTLEIEGEYLPSHKVGITYVHGEGFAVSLWEKLGPGMGASLKENLSFSHCSRRDATYP